MLDQFTCNGPNTKVFFRVSNVSSRVPTEHHFHWTNIKRDRKLLGKDKKGYVYIKYSKRAIVQEKQSLVLNAMEAYIELSQ